MINFFTQDKSLCDMSGMKQIFFFSKGPPHLVQLSRQSGNILKCKASAFPSSYKIFERFVYNKKPQRLSSRYNMVNLNDIKKVNIGKL